jgi:hypothetical protein
MYEEYIGKKVIVRSKEAGVFFGELVKKEGNEVKLKNCRWLWSWFGAFTIFQIAVEGVKEPEKCKFTLTVNDVCVLGVCQIVPCTDVAISSIEGVPTWNI